MTFAELQKQLARNPWYLAMYTTLPTPILGSPAHCILDTSRFGRRFIPFSHMLRTARSEKRIRESDLALHAGKTRSLICKLETPGQKKLHASTTVIFALAVGVGLEPSEAYTAYLSEVHPDARVVYYPDDPGTGGRPFGLPLVGAETRLRTPRPLPR